MYSEVYRKLKLFIVKGEEHLPSTPGTNLRTSFCEGVPPHKGVSILLGTYKVPPPNPCWLRTEMGRGLCFINARPELTRIRGGQRGKMVKIGQNLLKK